MRKYKLSNIRLGFHCIISSTRCRIGSLCIIYYHHFHICIITFQNCRRLHEAHPPLVLYPLSVQAYLPIYSVETLLCFFFFGMIIISDFKLNVTFFHNIMHYEQFCFQSYFQLVIGRVTANPPFMPLPCLEEFAHSRIFKQLTIFRFQPVRKVTSRNVY